MTRMRPKKFLKTYPCKGAKIGVFRKLTFWKVKFQRFVNFS